MLILFSSFLSKIPTWWGWVRARPALDAGVRGKSRKREINDRKIYISVGGYMLGHHFQSNKRANKSTRIDRSGGLLKNGRL